MTRPADTAESWQSGERTVLSRGRVTSYVQDVFTTPDGEQLTRQYLGHPGAVGIIAVDADDRVCCVRQFRRPMGMRFVEPPAGLLDHPDEDPLVAAQRELAEEAELSATSWQVLVDVCTSPGGSTEAARIYLATGLAPAPRPDGFVVEGEEAHMDVVWLPVEDVMDGILAGDLASPLLVSGVSALVAARATGTILRAADAPWVAREQIAPVLPEILPGG